MAIVLNNKMRISVIAKVEAKIRFLLNLALHSGDSRVCWGPGQKSLPPSSLLCYKLSDTRNNKS